MRGVDEETRRVSAQVAQGVEDAEPGKESGLGPLGIDDRLIDADFEGDAGAGEFSGSW